MLETFKLETRFEDAYCEFHHTVDVHLGKLLSGAFNMRTLHWDTDQEPLESAVDIRLAPVPFGQLRELELTCMMSFASCIQILHRSPLIERCVLHYVEEPSSFPPSDPVVLANLARLSIKTNDDIGPFFDALTLPSLLEIAIEYCSEGTEEDEDDSTMFPDWPHTAFTSLLDRSGCSLDELSLAVDMDPSFLDTYLLRISPTIKSLTVRGKHGWTPVDEDTLRILTRIVPPGRCEVDTIFPCLRDITLIACISFPLPEGVLADMVESRWKYLEHSSSVCNPTIVLAIRFTDCAENDLRRLEVMKRWSQSGRLDIQEIH